MGMENILCCTKHLQCSYIFKYTRRVRMHRATHTTHQRHHATYDILGTHTIQLIAICWIGYTNVK